MGTSFLRGECPMGGGISLDGGEEVEKNCRMGGTLLPILPPPHPTMGNSENTANSWGKLIQQNMLWEKIILKGNITNILNTNTKLLEQVVSLSAYSVRSVLIHTWNVKNSIIKTFFWTFFRNMKSIFQVCFHQFHFRKESLDTCQTRHIYTWKEYEK